VKSHKRIAERVKSVSFSTFGASAAKDDPRHHAALTALDFK